MVDFITGAVSGIYIPHIGHPLGYDGLLAFPVLLSLDLRTDALLSLEVLVREADFAVTSRVFVIVLVDDLLSNFCFFRVFPGLFSNTGEFRKFTSDGMAGLVSSAVKCFFTAFFAIAFAFSSL